MWQRKLNMNNAKSYKLIHIWVIFFYYIYFFHSMLQQEFFPKLIDLFRMCEKVKNMDGLYMIFRLVKAICEYLCFLWYCFFLSSWSISLVTLISWLFHHLQFVWTALRSLIEFLERNMSWTSLDPLNVGSINVI